SILNFMGTAKLLDAHCHAGFNQVQRTRFTTRFVVFRFNCVDPAHINATLRLADASNYTDFAKGWPLFAWWLPERGCHVTQAGRLRYARPSCLKSWPNRSVWRYR